MKIWKAKIRMCAFCYFLAGAVRRKLAATLCAGGDRGRQAAADLDRERVHRHRGVPPDRHELGYKQPHRLRLAQQQHPPRADDGAAAMHAHLLPQKPIRPVCIKNNFFLKIGL